MRKCIRTAIWLILFLLVPVVSMASQDCSPQLLKTEVLSIVKPLLRARIEAQKPQLANEDDEKYRNRVNLFYDLLYQLFHNRSKEADEAVAYLLFLSRDAHFAEEVDCEALIRGKRILPYINRFKSCLPSTGLEGEKYYPQQTEIDVEIINSINNSESCEHSH